MNPCITCGACCALFRASFYWAEADDATPGGVPVGMTEPFGPFRRAMKGTSGSKPRCIALEGTIGQSVRCTIHPQRAGVCRGFPASYEDGVTPNPRCDQAREAWGLRALRPEDWHAPDDDPAPDNDPELPPLAPAA